MRNCDPCAYLDDLVSEKAGYTNEIVTSVGTVAADTEEPGNWVENVSQDELQSKVVVAVQVEVAAPPGEEGVDESDERNNAQESCDNHAGNLDTEPSTVRERVKHVGGLVLIIIRDNDTASSESLLFLRVSQLGHG